MTHEKRYTTWGTVRGGCGHRHTTAALAQDCVVRDDRGCKRSGGYSDRSVRVIGMGEIPATGGHRAPGEALPIDEQD